MMAMEVTITKNGCAYEEVIGTPEEMEDLKKSYGHLCSLRDEVISMGRASLPLTSGTASTRTLTDAGTPAILSCSLEGGEGCHTIEKRVSCFSGKLFFLYFSYEKHCSIKKNSLSLHPQTTKGAIAQLVGAKD